MAADADTRPAPALKVAVVPVTPFQQNASIVVCTQTGRAAIVDPGGDVDTLVDALTEIGATPEKILLTHGHIDHAGGATDLAERLNVPIVGPHRADAFLLEGLAEQARFFGVDGVRPVEPGTWLADGDTVTVGALTFEVLHVPGHTPGHVVFLNRPSNFALVGDTLFRGSVGRTDFPYGDGPQLIAAIHDKLMRLPDAVTCLPGHGPATTIGEERRTNPFL
jgi:glyoxylase-like metal-dependent hydrolase (beta-lactamase superfamily II)